MISTINRLYFLDVVLTFLAWLVGAGVPLVRKTCR